MANNIHRKRNAAEAFELIACSHSPENRFMEFDRHGEHFATTKIDEIANRSQFVSLSSLNNKQNTNIQTMEQQCKPVCALPTTANSILLRSAGKFRGKKWSSMCHFCSALRGNKSSPLCYCFFLLVGGRGATLVEYSGCGAMVARLTCNTNVANSSLADVTSLFFF